MRRLAENSRSGKPRFYPDQSVYAEYACAEFGLAFEDIDGGTGLLFSVASQDQKHSFRRRAMLMVSAEQRHRLDAGIGQIFHQQDSRTRRRRRRWAANISSCMTGIAPIAPQAMSATTRSNICRTLGGSGLRQTPAGIARRFRASLHGEASLLRYLDEVSQYYDAILIQPVVSGIEYRVFLLDDEVVYTARKYPPFCLGDGVRSHPRSPDRAQRGLASPRAFAGRRPKTATPRSTPCCRRASAGTFPGRMNLSAGGTMVLEAPHSRRRVHAGAEGRARARAPRRRRRHVHGHRRRSARRCG